VEEETWEYLRNNETKGPANCKRLAVARHRHWMALAVRARLLTAEKEGPCYDTRQ
jgi:hypothetical protein